MNTQIVIFDTSNTPYFNNKIFDRNVSKLYPGANSITIFYELCLSEGYRVYTSDYVIKNNIDINGAFIITEISSKWTNKLIKKGGILTALVCLETPSFAWKFYSNLSKISKKYKHCFLFSGTKTRVDTNTIFHPTVFPQPDSHLYTRYNNKWSERNHLTLINSNQIRRVIKPMHIIATLKDKSLKQELYSLRLKAIEYFHLYEDFHLYGRNWDKKLFGIPKRQFIAAKKCYKGAVVDKVKTLSNYKFSLCFENAIFEGYITEKIFDCFYATCIPIYYGAPDVQNYIPDDCYIDFRRFKNFDDLNKYLRSITQFEFEQYQIAINKFLDSPDFEKFSESSYAKNLLKIIKK